MYSARHGTLPPPIDVLYNVPVRAPRESDVYHGQIVAVMRGGFMIVDEDGAGTTSVYLTPETRLPYGDDFATGTRILVVGDAYGTGSVRAFGIREIDPYPEW